MEKIHFKGAVRDFLDLFRAIRYPLSKEEVDANPHKYDVLIYVDDWDEISFESKFPLIANDGTPQKYMYLTSSSGTVKKIIKWMSDGNYKEFTGKRRITNYIILDKDTAEIIFKWEFNNYDIARNN